ESRLEGRAERIKRYDTWLSWGSMLSIMYMSFCNMNGVGNPFNDALITDFALGHSLIIVAIIIIGKRGAFVWFLIVVASLLYDMDQRKGWDYQYHYMTPKEAEHYEKALANNETWATERRKHC
ncbi:MAG: hypothetical protein AAGJ31_09885, partial [Verrucomicrobiota bacterium]